MLHIHGIEVPVNAGTFKLDALYATNDQRNTSVTQKYAMNNKMLKCISFMLIAYFTTACAPVELHPDNKPVRLFFYNEINLAKGHPQCTYIGPVVSSYGHWYNYLFLSNTQMTEGAIDDMYNKANELGANVVYINKNVDFTTSVTLLGQAYNCSEEDVR
jgi:hypothetical protein